MKRKIITISDDGIVSIPNHVQMSISEIADLFEISYPTIKKSIRSIEKLGIIKYQISDSYAVENLRIFPDYYDLEMIVALAFQVQSMKAKMLRNWLIQIVTTPYLNIQILTSEKWNNFFLN